MRVRRIAALLCFTVIFALIFTQRIENIDDEKEKSEEAERAPVFIRVNDVHEDGTEDEGYLVYGKVNVLKNLGISKGTFLQRKKRYNEYQTTMLQVKMPEEIGKVFRQELTKN